MTNSIVSKRTDRTSTRRDCNDSTRVDSTRVITRKNKKLHVYLTILVLSALFTGDGCMASQRKEGRSRNKSRIPARRLTAAYRCVKESNDVGCGIFQCLADVDSCELDGLHVLCQKLSRTAGDFNKIGKIFIKKSLHCMTQAIKTEFSSQGRRCYDMEKFVANIQVSCYTNHSLCRTARTNAGTFMEVLAVEDVLSKRASLQLFQMILGCGEETSLQYRNLITSTIGQSFLSTLHYLQDGAPIPLVDVLNTFVKSRD